MDEWMDEQDGRRKGKGILGEMMEKKEPESPTPLGSGAVEAEVEETL